MKTKDIFKENGSIAYEYIMTYDYPFEILPNLKDYILKLGNTLDANFLETSPNVWVHKNAQVHPSACLIGPCIIDDGATVRVNAYIRENVIIGKNCVVGNSCEIKNAILFDEVQVPHFNYVGDSILGYHVHMGAGAIISNLKSDKTNIIIKNGEHLIPTNLRKVGAFVGDYVEVGCNAVLNPGTVILPRTTIYPLTSVRGVIGENKIVKNRDTIIDKEIC